MYIVERSDNVIQYMENLRDAGNDGVAGEEIVQEQAGIHPAADAGDRASATSTRVFKANDTRYHSNLHIGELQWGTDPQDDSAAETPDLSFTVEVDYYDAPNATYMDRNQWRDNIEQNLALYGLNATLERDELISQQDIKNKLGFGPFNPFPTPPFSDRDVDEIENGDLSESGFRQQGTEAWMFVANNSTSDWGFTGTGGLSNIDTPSPDATTVLGREAITQARRRRNIVDDDLGNDFEEARNATRARAALHELGHVIDTGEADERETVEDEVYSGFPGPEFPRDFTPERIRPADAQWSIMGEGWNNQALIPAYDTQNPDRNDVTSREFSRFAFSIEEVTTVSNDEIID